MTDNEKKKKSVAEEAIEALAIMEFANPDNMTEGGRRIFYRIQEALFKRVAEAGVTLITNDDAPKDERE